MNDFLYYVYDRGDLIGGFPLLCTAVNFCESWRTNSIGVDLVDGTTGEIIDTWINGQWENGRF